MTDRAITTVEPLQQALALATEAGDIDALKDVQAMATALQNGARARGLGIEAENRAAEVVLRAERAIGQVLLLMVEAGELNAAGRPPAAKTHQPDAVSLHDLLGGRTEAVARMWASRYQRIARLADETFEAMLTAANVAMARISKVNFYATPPSGGSSADRAPSVREASVPAFARFRQGAYELLDWQVGDDGAGYAAANHLLELPTDELAAVGILVRALATAYTEARSKRA